jgi:hypothetical protein
MAGTVGAIFNGGLQLGAAVGFAACGSVQASVDAHEANKGGMDGYAGRRAAFRVLLGFVCLQVVAVGVFMRTGQVEYREEKTSGSGVTEAGEKGVVAVDKVAEKAENQSEDAIMPELRLPDEHV